MANGSYFLFDDDAKTYILTSIIREIGKLKHSIRAPYIAWKIIDITDLILDTHSTECTWQAF